MAALLLALLVACKRPARGGGPSAADVVPVVDDARSGLLFSWVDDKGEVHVEEKADAVPAAARSLVRVVDPATDAPPGKLFMVDLSARRADGTYAVRSAPRAELEDLVEERRKAKGVAILPNASAAAPASSAARERPPVIVYGASWCGPCHQVEAYLKQKGVPYVHKDIENDPGADGEMRAKLSRAGRGGGSIPVIDVRGTLLVGFDPGSLDRALASSAR